jgi:SnoaL-like domain
MPVDGKTDVGAQLEQLEHVTDRLAVEDLLSRAIDQHFTSHHMISNVRARFAGDRARAVAYFHSVHLDDPEHPDQHEDHGGWYLLELERSASAWRIRRLKQVSVWSAANRRPKGPLAASVPLELRNYLVEWVPGEPEPVAAGAGGAGSK